MTSERSLKLRDKKLIFFSRDSGKNSNDMGGAERAAEIAERAIKMLNKAVCKNENEGQLIDKDLFHMHQRTCLMYRFVSTLNL